MTNHNFLSKHSDLIITIDIKLSESLLEIKRRIEFKEGLEINKKLFSMEKLNNNCDSLETYGIVNNSNLTLGLGIKGGNDVKTVYLYCKLYKPHESIY
jgi:hypothetical protein